MELLTHGSVIAQSVFSLKETDKITQLINENVQENSNFRKTGGLIAIRSLLKEIPLLKPLIFTPQFLQKLDEYAEMHTFLSKAIYFDKPPQSNWYVTWHQDTTINVTEKIDTTGFSGWTYKGNTTSVIPPVEVLQNTITFRIHLDSTTRDNGALNIIPKHQTNLLPHERVKKIVTSNKPFCCEIEKGGLHIMQPLTLHASSKTTNKKRRRVIHLEFCCKSLPNGLEWAEKELIR